MPLSEPKNPRLVTRFAPSPSGLLHKGHAYSALMAYRAALETGGRFLLRIEDIDTARCKPEFTEAIYTDLHWLGLAWEMPVRCQSQHFADYQAALEKLKGLGVVYPCFCTRKDILAEIKDAERAPHGPLEGTQEGPVYPRLCHGKSHAEQQALITGGKAHAWRLDLDAALRLIGSPLCWYDQSKGNIPATPKALGDVVLARKDTPTSYHLSVVVDDALQGVNHIVRGQDLFHATHIHVVLQKLLSLPTPSYHHHALIMDKTGKRYAKRNKAATLTSLREAGISAAELITELTPKR
jgi:glutamyl-Q tRNA(Asp) synthetase